MGIPGLLDAIGLEAVEELVAMEEDRFIAVSRDLDSTLSSFLFLHPLRHRFGTARQAGILSAAEKAAMADVETMKKIVPLITCDAFIGNICELVLGVNIFDLNLGVHN